MNRPKILLADDHVTVRQGLKMLIESQDDMTVVSEASDGRAAVEQARTLRPDVVVMDISMPDLNGVDATRRLLAEMPRIKIIALSMNSDRRYVIAMFKAGAVGYLLKNSASEELIHAVHAVEGDLTAPDARNQQRGADDPGVRENMPHSARTHV